MLDFLPTSVTAAGKTCRVETAPRLARVGDSPTDRAERGTDACWPFIELWADHAPLGESLYGEDREPIGATDLDTS